MATVTGFTATPQKIDIQCMNTLSGGGTASLLVYDRESANKATYLADLGKTITITEDTTSITFFKGELTDFRQIGRNVYQMTAESGGRKLFKQPTKYSAVLGDGVIQYVKDDSLVDKQYALFDLTWDNAPAKALVCVRQGDLRKSTYHPTLATTTGGTNTGGSVNDESFDDGKRASSNRSAYVATATANGMIVTNTYQIYALENSQFKSIHIRNLASMSSDGNKFIFGTGTGKLEIYNYSLAAWEEVTEYASDSSGWSDWGGGVNAEIPFDTDKLFVQAATTVVDNYLNVNGAVNSAGYQLYDLKTRVTCADVTSGSANRYIVISYEAVTIEYDRDQTPSVGVGLISSVTASVITCDNTQPWSVANYPIADGYRFGDHWYILDWLNTVIASVFTSSGTAFTVNWAVTSSDSYTDLTDIYDASLGDLLARYTAMFNAIWWWEPADSIVYGKSLDNVSQVQNVGVDVTITQTHIIGGLDGVNDMMSIANLRTNLTVVSGAYRVTSALTEEYTLSLGDAYAVEIASGNTNAVLADILHTNLVYKYEKARRELRITVDFSKEAIFGAMGLGKWVYCKVPVASGSIVNFVAATEPLLIYGMGLRNNEATGYRDHVDLILQRRRNS